MFNLFKKIIYMLFVVLSTLHACYVRVLLDSGPVEEMGEKQFVVADKKFLCVFKDTLLSCNGKQLNKNGLRISPKDSKFWYQDTCYSGDLALIVQEKRWYVINNIPLEEYVYSVLRSESWPGWPLEVNKVFAIMVRTYAVHKILAAQSMKKKPLYDIKSTNIHQTYKGLHNFDHLMQAVQETQNIIITYHKRPIIAMYDSCCGGIIPAHISGFDFKSDPYLARPYACEYCSECKLYSWQISFEQTALIELLETEFSGLKHIKDVRVTTDKAGKVTEIEVRTGRSHKKISGATMYRLCKDIRSFCYTIKKEEKIFKFTGKGFGHHMGVCQWGVRAMVKKGFTEKQILDYYYPGTELMKLVKVEPQRSLTSADT